METNQPATTGTKMNTTEIELHPFAHLGPAPYTFIGVWSPPSKELQSANTQAYNLALSEKPSGCHGVCDHCGSCLTDHYMIRDAAGIRHVVGSSCIKKTTRPGKRISVMAAQALKAKRDLDTKKRHARDAAKLAELTALIKEPTVRATLATGRHPYGHTNRVTGEPLTYLDSVEWMVKNSGAAGTNKTLKAVKAFIASRP